MLGILHCLLEKDIMRLRPYATPLQVSLELIRMAILWHEMWHEALEEASRQYFGDQNVEGMLATLLPLHKMMQEHEPSTLKEISFAQVGCMDKMQIRVPPSFSDPASCLRAFTSLLEEEISSPCMAGNSFCTIADLQDFMHL